MLKKSAHGWKTDNPMDLVTDISELFNLARLKQNPISGLSAELHLHMYIPLKHVIIGLIIMYDFKKKF